tara:strand:+ start:51 stop:323 length:273 start_codon:yes stop_codon:yes gene_type:complete
MALQIQDITIWMIALAVFNYLIIYKRNKFFGSISYLLLGIMLFGVRTEFGYTEVLYGYIALIVMTGALINLIYEVLQMMGFGQGTRSFKE